MSTDKKKSLNDIKNYKKKLDATHEIILKNYNEIINEYLLHFLDTIFFKNMDYFNFILLRGLKTLTHIFNILLLYTKNINLTVYHCKKAYLFYVEFIGQIGNDNHSYLQLNSKDATLFVYKKTIFEINNEYRETFEISDMEERDIFDYINKYTEIYNEILMSALDNENMCDNKSKLSYLMYIQKNIKKIVNKLILSTHSIKKKNEFCDNYLYYKTLIEKKKLIKNECTFFNLSNLFFKKFTDGFVISTNNIYIKLNDNSCDFKINNLSPGKFTKWLFNRK
jgi:hypothetical protein